MNTPNLSRFIEQNFKSILGILVGVAIILSGIYVPGIASAIIQIFLVFTTDSRYQSHSNASTKLAASDSDGWWVGGFGVLCILFSGGALYSAWKKEKESAKTADPER